MVIYQQHSEPCLHQIKINHKNLNIGNGGGVTFWCSVHFHFTKSEGLSFSRDEDVHKTTCHATLLTVECGSFTCSDLGDESTSEIREWRDIYIPIVAITQG